MSGLTFGRLKVIGFYGLVPESHNALWLCKCECGGSSVTSGSNLRRGISQSCGCYNKERHTAATTKHGHCPKGAETVEYHSWCSMKKRTSNPNDPSYPRYGGRGIKVCERWVESFENFLADMGLKPSRSHTISRKDNDGDYEPSNCTWGTVHDQQNNRRNNRMLELNGQRKTLTDWARELGIRPGTISMRLNHNKWSVERALTTPVT